MSKKKEAWVGQFSAFNEALKYMLNRQSGEEKSIYTPWPKFNLSLIHISEPTRPY